jgi:hypothetical protein
MIIPKTRLVNNINQELSDNSTGQISPRDIRHNLLDIIDSIHLLTKDSEIESLNLGTPETRSVRVGQLSLDSLKLDGYTSTDNVAVGYATLRSSYQTRRNTAIGSYALSCNIHGDGNLALGYNSLAGNTTGYSNVGIGTHSLNANKRGHFNIAIGNAAGYYIGPDDSYKFYLASHQVDESYICDNPNGIGLTPLLYGDLQNNKLGINTNSLHSDSVLQTAGNISPSSGDIYSVGLPSKRWNEAYINTLLNGDTSISINQQNIVLASNSGIILDSNEIIIGGDILPDETSTHDIGKVDNRFNRGYFEEVLTNYLTALQKSFFAHKTIYLASSGEWSIDGGGPSSLYEYYPCPNSPDIVPTLDDDEIDGGGLVLQSTSNQYNFTFKSSDDSCGASKRWFSNIGIEISGIDNYLKTPAVISSESINCKGIFMSGEQIFFSDKDTYLLNENVAGNGHINYYAPSGNTDLKEFVVSHIALESGIDITQRFLSSSYPKQITDDEQHFTGFETKFFNQNENTRLVTRSYYDSINANKHLIMMSNDAGTLGLNNFSANGHELFPETIFNIRSVDDAVIRATAENDADSFSALQLLAHQNCLNSGVDISYQNNSGIFALNIYDNFNKYNVLNSTSGTFLGIYASSGTGDLVSVGSFGSPNTSIAIYQADNPPIHTELYGKLYVTNKDVTNQSQTLNFLDDEGNVFDLILSQYSTTDGLIYSENGNTFGGICPDVRGDIPEASNNTAFGYQALNNITTGDCNTMVGKNAGSTITTGFNNIGIGCDALNGASSEVTYNIVIGGDSVGSSIESNYNFMLGPSNSNLLLEGKMGPTVSDKHLYMPDGKLTLYGPSKSTALHFQSSKIEIQDFSGPDYPEDDFSIKFTGNETSDLMVLNHNCNPFDQLYSYKTFSPARPSVEVKGDVRVKGAIAFRDGSFMESASLLNNIQPLVDTLQDIFLEGFALEDIDTAAGVEDPTTGIIKLRNTKEVRVTNRDKYLRIKKDDYIIAIKIGGEYRPIWISNSSSSCTCCTR